MKRFEPRRAFAAGTLTFLAAVPSLSAHGGTYRGPGDTVPPGGGGGGGGAGGAAAGPAGPSSLPPGVAGPGRGLAGRPGSASARYAGGTGGDPLADLTAWTFWWEFNKEPYLELKTHVHAAGPRTGTEGFFLGNGAQRDARDSLAPDPEVVREKIVPALLDSLARETDNDVVTACLIALAKIGEPLREDGASRFAPLIAGELANPVQEIAETAAVALGILGEPAAVPLLGALLRDDERGRELVREGEVGYRTRAFAAYGLGLVGARSADEGLRRDVVRHLWEALEEDRTRSFDLGAACVIALGLVPLAPEPVPAEAGGDRDAPPPHASRQAQLDYLLAILEDERFEVLTRAHVPTALARLLAPGPSIRAHEPLPPAELARYEERAVELLIELLHGGGRNELRQSAVLALGLLGDADEDPLDRRIRRVLADVPRKVADQQTRHFATIAMALAGGDPGSGDASMGTADASAFLLGELAGKQTQRPWAGLAIGVLCDELRRFEREEAASPTLRQALRAALRAAEDDQRVGAYAIGAGIAGDLEAAPILVEKLERLSSDEARGYVMVALGLLGERRWMPAIQEVLRESRYRPELLKQAAIALGLLGDHRVVDELLAMLDEAQSLASQASIATALGFIGDRRSIDPLVRMLRDEERTDRARAFAAVALGIVADKERLPWNSKIGAGMNYRASTTTLNDPAGTGILNIK